VISKKEWLEQKLESGKIKKELAALKQVEPKIDFQE
jgi:hypothetical protein